MFVKPDVLRNQSASARFQENLDNRRQVSQRFLVCAAGTLFQTVLKPRHAVFSYSCWNLDMPALKTAYSAFQ
jgi:hypothetical protein